MYTVYSNYHVYTVFTKKKFTGVWINYRYSIKEDYWVLRQK